VRHRPRSESGQSWKLSNSFVDTANLLSIGKIVGAHGIKGVVKVFSYAESQSRYQSGMQLVLKDSHGNRFVHTVIWAKPHAKTVLLSLDGIQERSQAEAVIGSELFIEKAGLEELDEGSYYWNDLLGLAVYSVNGEYLGELSAIIPTGSNDVYVVKQSKSKSQAEVLIPALVSVVKEVDLDRKIMRVDLPEGL